jgi:uncharacterized protein
VLPVRDISRRAGEMREHELSVVLLERWGEGIVAVEPGTAVELDVRLESVHEGILVSGTASSRYEGECGRCLNEVSEAFQVEFMELFAYPGEEETDFEVQDDHVNLETLVRDVAVLALPFQPVCEPDCPGLDPVTGLRAAASAKTNNAAPVDPRWSALMQLTDQQDAAKDRN